jgi:predicted O-methyltransferase YrrM
MQGMDPEQFDLIFVDGDHSWANILPEFKEAERMIKPGGIMAYHDTIHIADINKLMEYAAQCNYNVITLNTSEGRGLSLIQKL